jgi:hypothetical protein
MAEQPLVPSLSRARELKINELSNHFANDDLSLEELEQRMERVYKATSVAELEVITADLKNAVAVPADLVQAKVVRGKGGAPARFEAMPTRIVSIMSSTKKVGRWGVPPVLGLKAIMSDTHIDLTHAVLTSNTIEMEVKSVMASLKIVVPPGMRVMVDTSSIMSSVESKADDLALADATGASTKVLHLTGYAFMSDVKIVVRRREDPLDDDYDDDDD